MCHYSGSLFHLSVQQFLSTNIDTRSNFQEEHRSKFNQKSIKEAKIQIIGVGKSFGDIDAYKQRNYMYTLRSLSNNVVIYEVESVRFINIMKSIGREN